ncbi:hypothetical protein P6U16_22110 (plasmid) [Rhizobium sp. 32-5/1]|uniref:hypothetical protein n=1 Tax=Rhizobium sp. 32-5/1 TaxID=3019602 RepID=UPI00240E4588|nr:hypothetical protein [Rhizobium sp. 32-5/1]WEZ86128.1 hypothetical protein P6U16_22110 [Rhizobium sp. 32-5/1]
MGGSIDQSGLNENGFWLKLAFLSLMELDLKISLSFVRRGNLFDLIDFRSVSALQMVIARRSAEKLVAIYDRRLGSSSAGL